MLPGPAWFWSRPWSRFGSTCAFRSSRASARSLRVLRRQDIRGEQDLNGVGAWTGELTVQHVIQQWHQVRPPDQNITVLPDDALPGGSVLVVLLLRVQPDVLLLVQLKPVHQALPVPTYRLQTHFFRVLLIDGHLELQVVVELTLAQILKVRKEEEGEEKVSVDAADISLWFTYYFLVKTGNVVLSGCLTCTPWTFPGSPSAPAPMPRYCSTPGKPTGNNN